jgi:N-acetylglucosamine-6-sulfatase
MISEEAAVVISDIFKNRWRTLMSVDDVIAGVIGACEDLGVADNTYFFYSSDHGFQLGEFNIPMDKRQPYDWDTRIHLLARGPGITAGAYHRKLPFGSIWVVDTLCLRYILFLFLGYF